MGLYGQFNKGKVSPLGSGPNYGRILRPATPPLNYRSSEHIKHCNK